MANGHAFCWVDYTTKNPGGALSLFTSVFPSWSKLMDMPGYTMLRDSEASTMGFGGIGAQPADSKHPTCWIPYIETLDIRKTFADALAAGAKEQNPVEEMGPGTFAVLQDPTGASFALWMNSNSKTGKEDAKDKDQTKPEPAAAAAAADAADSKKKTPAAKGKKKGAAAAAAAAAEVKDEKKPEVPKKATVVLHQLVTTDVTRAIGFYQRVFGWTGEMTKLGDGTPVWNWHWPKPPSAAAIAAAGAAAANAEMAPPREFPIMAQLLELPPDAGHAPMWVTIFRVADAAAAQKRMEAAGCTVEVPCCKFAPFGRLVCGRDPNKGFLALLEVDHSVKGMTTPSPDAIKADAAEASGGESGVKQFAWVDLQVKDAKAAAVALDFYRAVFPTWGKLPGMDVPKYTLLHDAAGDISGFGGITEERNCVAAQTSRQVWVPYVDVDCCDTFTAKAKQLGGTVLLEPMETGPVRISYIRDPSNAVIALCQPLQDKLDAKYGKDKASKNGAAAAAASNGLSDKAMNGCGGKTRNPATVTWHQLVSANPKAALAFYKALFGWTGEDTKLGDTTWQHNWRWPTATVPRGWQPRQSEVMASCIQLPKVAGSASFWLCYFKSDDVDAAVARVTKAGGTVSLEPCDHPEGRIAVCADPSGATFAIMQRKARPNAAAASAAMADDADANGDAADAADAKPKKGKGKGKGKAKGKGKKAGAKRKSDDDEGDDDDAEAAAPSDEPEKKKPKRR